MSGIRVTYSGLISFTIGLVGIVTGLIFTLIITRELSPEEFGVWSLIGSLTIYVLAFEPIISYWTTREIARGEDSGKTAIFSGGLFTIGAIPLYICIVILFFTNTEIDKNILIFSVLLVPVLFFRHILAGINLGHKPQNVSYGILIFEITKIPFAVFLIYLLDMGVYGAIITTFLASLGSIIIQIILSFEKIKGVFNKKILKKWIKLFWLPTYPRISEILGNSDVIIVTIIVGSAIPVAFWASSMAISGIVLHSVKISKAVYPKLLASGKKEYFQDNFTRVFYFAFPLVAISITFSRPGLFALNPAYEIAFPIVSILSILMLLRGLSNIFSSALTGIESIDTKQDATFREYIKSKLVYLPTLKIIQRGIYIGSLVLVLLFLNSSTNSHLELVTIWSIIALITQIPFTLYLYLLIRKNFQPKIEGKAIIKYLLASIISFSIGFFLMEKFLNYTQSIFEFLPQLIPIMILSVVIYVFITNLIDSKTRKLFKSIILEIKKK